jgi:predicted CXXCH cytochrome family protein
MRARRIAGDLGILLALLWSSGVLALSPVGEGPGGLERRSERGESSCGSCHLAGREVTPGNARELRATQERLCGRCHRGAVEASHPTGFVPGRPLPREFPLDWKGEVTCSTCHDPHEAVPGRLRAALRGRAFCLACHPAGFFDGMPEGGLSLTASGHIDARTTRLSEIDAYSMRCVVCHENRASAFGDGIRGTYRASNGTGMRNHPIGAPTRTRASLRRPVENAEGGMLVPDGKVSCLSCHRAYTRDHGALVRRDIKLCTHCHEDK